jgi:dihydroflavonol-4-reductase
MKKVLVTGTTGFIGLHCVQQLLEKGFAVNGTLRSFDRKDEVINALSSHNTSTEHLSLFETDLLEDKGWDEAIQGCEYVLHVASPFVLTPESEDFFVKPAVEGSLRVLKLANKHKVKKLVLTSSFAAMVDTLEKKDSFDESDWSDPNKKGIRAYGKSKTLAEKAAWDYMASNTPSFSLTVINPVAVTGPSLSKDIGTSNSIVGQMINGNVPGTAKVHIGYVDVRDVAAAHITAMLNNQTDGERIIVFEKTLWMDEVATILRDAGFDKAPSKVMPKWAMHIMSIFKKDLKFIVPLINKKRHIHSTKATDLLHWEPISAEESIVATAKQLQEYNLA